MKLLNKFLTLLPSLFLIAILIKERYTWSPVRETITLSETLLNLSPFVFYVVIDVFRRKEKGFLSAMIQSSYYVYVLAVLYLTILFVPIEGLKVVEMNTFLDNFNYGINLTPFQIFNYYDILDKQIIGNLIMLLPLGIYIPLLYKRDVSFINISFVGFTVAIAIETIQFVFSFLLVSPVFFQRSVDIDDVILNFSGFLLGFMLYKIFYVLYKKNRGSR